MESEEFGIDGGGGGGGGNYSEHSSDDNATQTRYSNDDMIGVHVARCVDSDDRDATHNRHDAQTDISTVNRIGHCNDIRGWAKYWSIAVDMVPHSLICRPAATASGSLHCTVAAHHITMTGSDRLKQREQCAHTNQY